MQLRERLSLTLREKCPTTEFFLVRFFPVFSSNTGKYGPEKTPYFGTFTQCELQESIEKLLQNKLSVFKVKYEELVSTSYANLYFRVNYLSHLLIIIAYFK